jgi:Tol biopolymer transport system component
MRITRLHQKGLVFLALIFWGICSVPLLEAQTALPPGAVSIVNQDRFGSMIALCADTGEPVVQQGAKKIRGTGVWVGRSPGLRRVQAGLGACDPAWSPDGRRLALTAADGLWVFPSDSPDGDLRVQARLPLGGSSEFHYRAFSHPRWSPDGALVALVVTNGGTTWVEVFEAASGRLFYTSPPENASFTWSGARELKLDKGAAVQLPTTSRR